jgi:metal-responsive CopG/Arc/MetJ family transcriptional regulator
MRGSTKLSISLPTDLLDRAEARLQQPTETRSAFFARLLRQAIEAADEADIDAEYARAYADQPYTEAERASQRALQQLLARRLAGETPRRAAG